MAAPDYYNLEHVPDTAFYGFRVDWATGRLNLEKVDPTDPTVISLPDTYAKRDNDYVDWVFTKNTLQFSWNNSDSSHLLVEVL